jgi:hypothetical protein
MPGPTADRFRRSRPPASLAFATNVLVGALVVFSSSSCFRHDKVYRQGAKPMEEHLIGRSVSLNEAAMQASVVTIAEVVELGTTDLGAPGQTYWENTRIRIVEPLKGKPESELVIAYTVQTIPAEIAERAPKKGETLIFFLQMRKDQSHRAMKALFPTPEHLKQLREILGIKPNS